MARYRRRKKRGSLGGWLHRMPRGLGKLALGTGIIAFAGGVLSQLSGYLDFTLTLGSNSYTIPLGTIGTIIVAFAGLFILKSGIEETGGIKI